MAKKLAANSAFITTAVLRGEMKKMRSEVHSSIDTLAQAVQVGFQETHQLIYAVRDDLKADVKSLQGDVQRIDSRLGRQQEIIDETKQATRILDGRMSVVEAKVGAA